jgi:hypothetical protein
MIRKIDWSKTTIAGTAQEQTFTYRLHSMADGYCATKAEASMITDRQ